MCRSEPQMPEASTRTIASSGAFSSGSGRSSTESWPGFWNVTASIRRGSLTCPRQLAAAKQRGRAVALLAVVLPELGNRGEHALEADLASPLERASRPVQPELGAGVDVV